jgi:enoyl-CoA hydratase/carnithine racemase
MGTLEKSEDAVLLRRDEAGVAWLTLNRPAARNALSHDLMSALQEALDTIAPDRSVKVVVIGGAGPAFCAGHDLREIRANPGRQHYGAVFSQCSRLMTSIVTLPKPVIARVHGVATAAGCQLVATCDLAVAADGARFATPGVNIGLFCSTPMVALSRAVPRKAALEMLFTGEPIDAHEARRIGLINRVVAAGALEKETDTLARYIAAKPTQTLKIGKLAFQHQLELGVSSAYDYVGEVMVQNMLHAEAQEGIGAFLEKRTPKWPEN